MADVTNETQADTQPNVVENDKIPEQPLIKEIDQEEVEEEEAAPSKIEGNIENPEPASSPPLLKPQMISAAGETVAGMKASPSTTIGKV